MKVMILGGGGRMAKCTVMDFLQFDSDELKELVLADVNLERAEEQARATNDPRVKGVFVDVGDLEQTTALMRGVDVVVNSSTFAGDGPVNALRAALQAGVHIIDLGAVQDVTDRCLEMNEEFEKANLSAILGLGSSPGIMNLIAKAIVDRVDEIDSLHLSFAYASLGTSTVPFKIPFLGALYEFSCSPLVFRGGEYATLSPMSEVEDITYPDPIGVRRCFSIGHPEIFTFPSSFESKGLKDLWFKAGFTPEFFEQGKFLNSIGLLTDARVQVGDDCVVPMDLVEKCAADLPPDAGDIQDYGVTRVVGRGQRGNDRVRITAMMVSSPYCGLTSAQHRTGHPPAIGARMLVRNQITRRGVYPPELHVDPEIFFRELARRELEVEITETTYV